jgi:hypothetical protein
MSIPQNRDRLDTETVDPCAGGNRTPRSSEALPAAFRAPNTLEEAGAPTEMLPPLPMSDLPLPQGRIPPGQEPGFRARHGSASRQSSGGRHYGMGRASRRPKYTRAGRLPGPGRSALPLPRNARQPCPFTLAHEVDAPHARITLGKFADDRPRAVTAAVVDENDLVGGAAWVENASKPAYERTKGARAVVRRHHHRNRGRFHPAESTSVELSATRGRPGT